MVEKLAEGTADQLWARASGDDIKRTKPKNQKSGQAMGTPGRSAILVPKAKAGKGNFIKVVTYE